MVMRLTTTASSLFWSQCSVVSGFVSLGLPYHDHSALQSVLLFPCVFPIRVTVHYSQWFCFPGPSLSWSQCTTDSAFVSLGLPYHGHSALQTVLLFPWAFPIMVTVHYRQCFCFPGPSLSWSQCLIVSLGLPYHGHSALQTVVLFPWAFPIMVTVLNCFPGPSLSGSQCTTVSAFVSLGLPYHGHSALTGSAFVSLYLPYRGHSALQSVLLFPWAFPIMIYVHYRQ